MHLAISAHCMDLPLGQVSHPLATCRLPSPTPQQLQAASADPAQHAPYEQGDLSNGVHKLRPRGHGKHVAGMSGECLHGRPMHGTDKQAAGMRGACLHGRPMHGQRDQVPQGLPLLWR